MNREDRVKFVTIIFLSLILLFYLNQSEETYIVYHITLSSLLCYVFGLNRSSSIITIILSESMMVFSLCAIVRTVQFWNLLLMVS